MAAVQVMGSRGARIFPKRKIDEAMLVPQPVNKRSKNASFVQAGSSRKPHASTCWTWRIPAAAAASASKKASCSKAAEFQSSCFQSRRKSPARDFGKRKSPAVALEEAVAAGDFGKRKSPDALEEAVAARGSAPPIGSSKKCSHAAGSFAKKSSSYYLAKQERCSSGTKDVVVVEEEILPSLKKKKLTLMKKDKTSPSEEGVFKEDEDAIYDFCFMSEDGEMSFCFVPSSEVVVCKEKEKLLTPKNTFICGLVQGRKLTILVRCWKFTIVSKRIILWVKTNKWHPVLQPTSSYTKFLDKISTWSLVGDITFSSMLCSNNLRITLKAGQGNSSSIFATCIGKSAKII